MKARELFEGVIKNKMPTLDIIDAIEEIGDVGNGVTKEKLELMLSDFSWYLQDYVDLVLEKRKSDGELLELYNQEEEKEWFRNAYIIQEYYKDAGLSKNQMLSILRFIGILQSNIERIEYLRSDKVTMGEAIGDIYKKGMPNSFFTEVYEGNLSDSKIYSKVQELTDNFDETKLNLLCNDFDFYLFMVKEYDLSHSREEIEDKIKEYEEAGKEIPMLSDRNPSPSQVSGFFKTPEHKKIKKEEDWTKEQLQNLEEMAKDWQESKKNILDEERLFDPHGIELFSLYRLRNLLVQLKVEHTSAKLRPKFKSKFDKADPINKNFENSNQYINWLETDESLEQFIEALKEQNLIKTSDTGVIINNHFQPHREQNSKPEPIEWLETIALLAYMIELLAPSYPEDRQCYIKPENIWSDTAPHFSVNGQTPQNLRQTANRFKQNKSGKPKNHEIIDSIIQSLPE